MTDARARLFASFVLLSPVIVIVALSFDARVRRASACTTEAALDVVAPRLPSSDLALSGGARWLRAPSLEEPGAAFADGPGLPDPDPAGGAMAPPTDAWSDIDLRSKAPRLEVRRAR